MSYNLSQLRVLWEFASDGLVPNPFLAHSALSSGDFQITNLKSDIVEQKWRTTSTNNAFFILDCGRTDNTVTSPQRAVIFDTMALLGTNLTEKAVIKVYAYGQAYDSFGNGNEGFNQTRYADFLTVAQYYAAYNMSNDPYEVNFLWASSTEVIQPYRYWMIEIVDPTNPDEFIEVGRFVAGQATILTELENFTSDVKYSEVNYKDEMSINGFSSISNNRALKKKLTVQFDKLNVNGENWRILRRMLRYIRDTKKALVLPDPTDVYRFNLFAKLKTMPEQKISYIQSDSIYATFDLEWDEGR